MYFIELASVGHILSVATILLCYGSVKAAADSTSTNEQGCVSTEFYLWILKFEFHLTFMFQELLIFFGFFNYIKM